MNCRILHESRGRLRVRLLGPAMTVARADILEAYLTGREGVRSVQVFDRTGDAVILYGEGRRENVIAALADFSYEENRALAPEHSSRAITREYEDKIALRVMGRFFKKLFLPAPVRTALAVVKAVGYVRAALRCLLVKRRLEVPVLDAAAITVSLLRGDSATASSVMFLLELGDTLEEWTHKKSVADLARTMSLNVDTVWRVDRDGQRTLAGVEQVAPGELVEAGTGNVIPLDGVVFSGEASVNQASMTGESVPVPKRKGSLVYAGTVVEEGRLVIEVTHASGSGRYDRIVSMIEESEKLKSASEDKASHLADRLVPWCFGGTLLTWLLTRNIDRAVSVLMVDFSCALKLSMPLSVLSAMREAGKYRITVKGGKYLEKFSEADTIIFDKTGTLTNACPTVVSVVPFNGQDEEEMLRVAACLEEHFPHSVANAVVRAAQERNLNHQEMHSEPEYVVAHGIATKIDGERVIIGSRHFVFEDEGTVIRAEDQPRFNILNSGFSWLYLAIGGTLSAAIGILDPLRPEAKKTVELLHRTGISKTVMLTGDSRNTAEAIAQQLGIDDYHSEVLPEDKARYIQKEQAKGHTVVMIGDGINDAPALSLADVGIAIGSGATIAREVADITIAAEDLQELVLLRQLSDKLMLRIGRNYRFVMGFNSALILLGALGVLAPSTSALLHNSSTLLLSMDCLTNLLPE